MSQTSNNADDKQQHEVEETINIPVDGDVGDALEKGMDALKSVFGGIVDMVQDTIGPDGMKNLGAGQWLTQVSTSLEEAAKSLRDGAVSAGKAGELSCFLDRIEEELTGSKFESQLPSMLQKLQTALTVVQSGDSSDLAGIDAVADAAGYFSAAASSIVSTGSSGSST